MLFNSIEFLVFFILFFSFYWFLNVEVRKYYIVFASIIFYGWHEITYVFLIIYIATVVWIYTFIKSGVEKKNTLILSITLILIPLFYFKYSHFLIFDVIKIDRNEISNNQYINHITNIILPVGISFYTFQAISYIIDFYKGRITQRHNYIEILSYLFFFPQLVAGPVIRAKNYFPRLQKTRFTIQYFLWGAFLIIYGLFYKLAIADNLAPYVNSYYENGVYTNGMNNWFMVYSYSFQIYSDFLGYSSIAIGLAYILGFSLPVNFNQPYLASSFQDFWRRWHISLSSWFRDYVYIPLGGRESSKFKSSLNVIIVMLIAGLWHGSSWNFVVWGGLCGVCIIMERILFARIYTHKWVFVRFIYAVFIVHVMCLLWVFFRSPDFNTATSILSSMFSLGTRDAIYPEAITIIALLISVASLIFAFVKEKVLGSRRLSIVNYSILSSIMVWSTFVLSRGGGNAFIYFQF